MRYAALMLSLAGCLAPASTECDALLCPPGKVCAAGFEVCVFADQVRSCVNQAEHAACNFDGAAGVCTRGVCVTPVCGDGIVVSPEVCDIAAPQGGACSSDCRSDLRCGNGIVDPGETCDCGDANLPSLPLGCKGINSDDPTASCSARCTIHGCGDGIVSGLEQCDPAAPPAAQTCQGLGFYESTPVTCTSFCLYDPSPCHQKCGDGIVNGGEACDQAPPFGQSCLDYNFDGGRLGCHNPICVADVSRCVRAGWVRTANPGGVLSGLVVKGHDDVYVVSDGNKVFHYDGGWKSLGSPSPQANGLVWANAVDDVFFVDTISAGAFHYDGTSWTRIFDSHVGLDAVFSTGRNDAFIGGTDKIWHWDGQTTTEMAVPAAIGAVRSIRGRAPNDVYALTLNALLHYDGTHWTEKTAATGSMFAIGQIWSGTLLATVQAGVGWYDIASDTWTVRPVSLPLNVAFDGFEAWGAAPDDVFVVAAKGQIVHWDGKRWLPRQEPFRDDLTDIGGAAANDIWMSSSSSLFRYSGPSGSATHCHSCPPGPRRYRRESWSWAGRSPPTSPMSPTTAGSSRHRSSGRAWC